MGNGISSVGRAAARPAAFAVQEIPAHIQQRILSSMGKVLFGDQALGCGVLVGIDRLLIPLHIIPSLCPENLRVQFGGGSVFAVLYLHAMDRDRDFAILQLSCDACGLFPGNQRWCALPSYDAYQGEFLFASFIGEIPSFISSRGSPCGPAHFCSEIETVSGCSGSGYFDRNGNLFALHLSRATGLCEFSSDTRRALYMRGIAAELLLHIDPCCLICPPKQPGPCAPNDYFFKDPCFTEEGPKAIRGQIDRISYWEWKPGNNHGPGPRGLTIAIPNKREKITYKFNPNPHDIRKYNKDQEELYLQAAQAFVNQSKNQTPRLFKFNAYGKEFTATLET